MNPLANLIYADRIEETTVTTGTQNLVLNGVVTGNRSFASALSTGDQFYYSITGGPSNATEWEVGVGTWTETGTIERAAILSSSGTGPADLSIGTKTVSLTVAAQFYETVQAHDVFAAWQAMPGNAGRSVEAFLEAATEASATTFTVTPIQPATPTTAISQDMVVALTPDNPDGQPAPTTMRLSMTHNPYAANSQGFTHPAYTNKTVGLSVGATPDYGKIDPSQAAASMIMEHGFFVQSRRPGGGITRGVEFHWQMVGTDYAGYRPLTVFSPWTGADAIYDASISIQGAQIDFKGGDGQSKITFNIQGNAAAPKSVDLDRTISLNHAGNNVPWLRQFNAAGATMLPLPYINAQNQLQVTQPIYAPIVATPAANPLGIQSLLTLYGTGGFTNGARMIYLTVNAITGSGTGFEADLSASTRFEGLKIRNSHASGASGGRIVGNGNLYLDFYRETDFQRWGLRLKSNGDFTIGQTAQGADIADALRINFTTLQTQFMKAPRLPGATLSGAGSAATAGAGALHYVTDLTATTPGSIAAGGGSSRGVVVSDGAGWRIMAAW